MLATPTATMAPGTGACMIRIEVRRAREFEGVEAVLADALSEATARLSDLKSLQDFAFPGKDVVIEVVLGGDAEAAEYDVDRDALGFFAVASGGRRDYDVETDDEAGIAESETFVLWQEVCDGFQAHVNVRRCAALLAGRWSSMDDLERACDLEGVVVTVPHEVLHAAAWVRASGGRTPGEVYDAEDGIVGLRRMQEASDALLPEDAVEDMARGMTAAAFPFHAVDAWVARLDAEMPAAAPTP